MKFNILIVLVGLATGQDFEKEATFSDKWGKVMDDFSTLPSNTWEAVKTTAAKIPARRHQNNMRSQIDPQTGNHFVMRKNADIDREYDRAIYRVYNLRESMGYAAPYEIFRQENKPSTENVGNKPGNVCAAENIWGFATGVAKGLQYNSRRPSECYLNIETTMLQADALVQMFWFILLPWEWARLTLAAQDLLTLVTRLFSLCNLNKMLDTFLGLMTYEGVGQMLTRSLLGLEGDIQFFYEKYAGSTDSCIQGESIGKIAKLIVQFTI